MEQPGGGIRFGTGPVAIYRLAHNEHLEGDGLQVVTVQVEELGRMHRQRGVFTRLDSDRYFELQGFLDNNRRGDWHHVDFGAGWLRLEPGETKNGEGRMFPLTPQLRTVLERQREAADAAQRETGSIIPWLFFRVVKPGRRRRDDGTARTTVTHIKSFRRAWLTACRLAGVPGRIPHDFRRTAVRNLERAGVPRSAAMKMVGHRTEAIYRRYAIADESMLRDAGARLAALHGADSGQGQAKSGRVVKMPARRARL